MKEQWKDIPNYEGLYRVSNLGRVKSLRNNIYLKPSPDGSGYPMVCLCNKGKEKTTKIHRLVAENFLSKKPNQQVNHIDFNKNNNRVDNLEWITHRENIDHAVLNGRFKNRRVARGSDSGTSKLTYSQVLAIVGLQGLQTSKEVGSSFGVSRRTITDIWNGVTWLSVTGFNKQRGTNASQKTANSQNAAEGQA